MTEQSAGTARLNDIRSPRNEGRQRVGVLLEVPQVLRSLGHEPADVFPSAGLELSILDSPENEITFVAMGRLLHACSQRTRCEHFGLLAGQRLALQSLGLVAEFMQTAGTLEQALQDLVFGQARNADGAVCYLRRMEHFSVFGYAIYQPETPGMNQIIDGALALAHNVITALAGKIVIEAAFSHTAPADIVPFKRVFGDQVRFDAEESGLLLPSSALRSPIRTGNAGQRAQIQAVLQAHSTFRNPDVSSQVKRLLRTRVISSESSIEEIARLLSLHPRTLLRKLKTQETTFRELLSETRFEVACQLLGGTRLSITQISSAIGYAETAVFSRAFERWSGLPPSEWRAARKRSAPPS